MKKSSLPALRSSRNLPTASRSRNVSAPSPKQVCACKASGSHPRTAIGTSQRATARLLPVYIDEMYRRKSRRMAAGAAAVVISLGIATACSSSSEFGSQSDPKPRGVEVAQFFGDDPDSAHNYLEDELPAEMTTDIWDLSPAGRRMNRYEDIIVASNKKVVTADDPEIQFWTLTPAEVEWFGRNPRMPEVKLGTKCEYGYGSKNFETIDGVVFVAAKPGVKRDQYAERIRDSYDFETDQNVWPDSWAKRQRARVGALWEMDTYSSVVSGQRPKPGTDLRLGQLMVVFCSPVKEDAPSGREDYDLPDPPIPNSNDDNFDVPDRLCPTRFC